MKNKFIKEKVGKIEHKIFQVSFLFQSYIKIQCFRFFFFGIFQKNIPMCT